MKEGPRRLDGGRSAQYRCTKARSGRCSNLSGLDRDATDKAVLELITQEVLQADAVERTLDAELAEVGQIAAERERVTVELRAVQAEINRLVTALAAGVAIDAISAGLKERESVKQALTAKLEHLDGRTKAAHVDREALRASISDWRLKLSANPTVARQVLSRLLPERITFRPDGTFYGPASFGALFSFTGGASEAEGRFEYARKTGTSGSPSVTPRSNQISISSSMAGA